MDKLSPEEWLDAATEFTLSHYNCRTITIEYRNNGWVVMIDKRWCFCKYNNEGYFEDYIHNRNEEFYKATRFDSKEEAYTTIAPLIKRRWPFTLNEEYPVNMK
jgi:hypothetical protein